MDSGRVDGLANIETPYVLQAPPIVTTSRYPRHVVREGQGDRVRAKTVSRKRALALVLVHHGRWRGLDILHIREPGNRTEPGYRQATAGRARVCEVAESDVELGLGVERRRVEAAFVGESRGVERCDVWHWATWAEVERGRYRRLKKAVVDIMVHRGADELPGPVWTRRVGRQPELVLQEGEVGERLAGPENV
jgi:hypothetical protein